eukprot:10142428-Karenia_brevis.AAC.1
MSEQRRKTCPRYGVVVKAAAGEAPVPKAMWRGACANVQRKLFRHFRHLGFGPHLRTRRKGNRPSTTMEAGIIPHEVLGEGAAQDNGQNDHRVTDGASYG